MKAKSNAGPGKRKAKTFRENTKTAGFDPIRTARKLAADFIPGSARAQSSTGTRDAMAGASAFKKVRSGK